MKPEAITALRKELKCTTHELADVLGVSFKTILAWEQDEAFPTKRYVQQMEALREQGPGAVPRKRRGNKKSETPMQVLSDPEVWRALRKMIAHPELRKRVLELAGSYDEPD